MCNTPVTRTVTYSGPVTTTRHAIGRRSHRYARTRASSPSDAAGRLGGKPGTTTTETALLTRGFSQLYLSLGDPNPDGSLAVRLYYKPLVLLIWLGAVVMMIGGALSLSDRRLRVGAPRPARSKDNAKAALQPAE